MGRIAVGLKLLKSDMAWRNPPGFDDHFNPINALSGSVVESFRNVYKTQRLGTEKVSYIYSRQSENSYFAQV